MAGRPARPPRRDPFPVLVRFGRGEGRRGPADGNPSNATNVGIEDAEPQDADPAREEDLERLIAQVREARERLSALIGTLRADRPDWEERAQRWKRWQTETLRRAPYDPRKPNVH